VEIFGAKAQVKICVTSVGMQQRGCGGSHTNIRSIISPQDQVMPQTSVCSSDVYRLNNEWNISKSGNRD